MKQTDALSTVELLLMESDDKTLHVSRSLLKNLAYHAVPREENNCARALKGDNSKSQIANKLRSRVNELEQEVLKSAAEVRWLKDEVERLKKGAAPGE